MAQRPQPSLRFADGGVVPGSGRGDKIPAKYEPGEFVVSNDMIADNPGLREQLSGLRAETLAARGKTVEEADAKALQYRGGRPSLRAVGGFGSDGEWIGNNRPVQPTGGGNTVSPSAQLDALKVRAREAAAAKPPALQATTSLGAGVPNNGIPYVMPPEPIKATTSLGAAPPAAAPPAAAPPTAAPRAAAPSPVLDAERLRSAGVPPPTSLPLPPDQAAAYDASPEGRATKAQVLKDTRGYFQGKPSAVAPSAAAVAAPGRLRAAYDGFTGRNFVGPNPQLSAGTRAARMLGPAVAVASEAPGVARVALDPNSSGIDVATQVAGASGKLAAAGLGAKAGAALGSLAGPIGTAAGGIIGGAAGYFGADSAIKAGRSAVGTEVADPAERVAATPTPAPSTPSLRVRPEDAFAGPPALAAGMAPPAAAPAAAAAPTGYTNNVTRNGNEYSGANVRGNITINGFEPGAGLNLGSGPNAQNMAAGNALAARNGPGGAADATGGLGGMALPQAPTVRHSGNDWNARNTLRNAEVSASSITNTRRWGGKGAENSPDVQAYKAMVDNDLALQRTEPGMQLETLRSNNSLRGQKLTADASRYSSDNSLRGTMYAADSQLGGKRMEMEQRLRQQQAMGELWKASGGKPEVFQQLAMQYGMADAAKTGGEMVAARQAQAKANSEDAQSTFKGMFLDKDGKPDPNGEAMAHHLASQIVPGWENMSQEQRNANRSKVVEYTNMLQQANKNRDTGWLQKFGLAPSSTARSQIPDLNGAVVDEVGLFEGALKPNIGRGDKKVTLRDGSQMYFDSLNEAQQRLLEINGARRQQ